MSITPSISLHYFEYCNFHPGFRFKPTDEELDVYGIEPWKLNWTRKTYMEDNVRYYFVQRKKSSNGKGSNRKSVNRYYWKNLNGNEDICNGKALKTRLRFVAEGSSSSTEGFQNGWIMHEYKLKSVDTEWVLCRIIKKIEKKKRIVEGIEASRSVKSQQVELVLGEIEQILMNEGSYSLSDQIRYDEIYQDIYSQIWLPRHE
ncbi:hypothetical protein TIFTF001_001634 [Ficus carica]|uniref:NAC domain-containing protein n=1 Tax=Ficus carica TaxID=3494 RepID=A0AA88CS48_FICCA|nr:hypothetical protein TIFTF001_001634 [Ficus carica]